MYAFEKTRGRPQPRNLLEDFRNAVLECELDDLGFVNIHGRSFEESSNGYRSGWIEVL